jgi:OmpA-OmpF porin, OOP family
VGRVRHAALFFFAVTSALPRAAAAACQPPAACVDTEPAWLAPGARRFATLAAPDALAVGELGLTAMFTFRLRPAVLTVPAPNRDGRDVNVVSHATHVSLGARLGIGHRLELTLAAPVGLYQRGAGIKGVTSQAADAIPTQGLHDPRVGFGFALPTGSQRVAAKLRFEAKLPLGTDAATTTEPSVVGSPSLTVEGSLGGWFAGAEVGARLRRPGELYGLRVGSQASVALGLGYELAEPRITLALEAYALPSLVDSGSSAHTPSEWLLSAQLAPSLLEPFAFGLGGGGGLPLSSDVAGTRLAYGVPTLRALAFVRYATFD